MRRLLAGLLVMSFSLALLPPVPAAEHEASHPCHASASPGAESVTYAPDADCHHGIAHHCSVLGCVVVGPALASQETALVAAFPADWTTPRAAAQALVHLTTGPPTPPPNS